MAYQSLTKTPLRRDWSRNQAYSNEIEFLECGVKKWATYYTDPNSGAPIILSYFTHVDESVIPEKGWGIEMVGYTLPYAENPMAVGEHMIARIHDQIPLIKVRTYNYHVVRNTYTIWTDKSETMDPTDLAKYYEYQLTAFAKSATNWMRFLSYEIFTDLGSENGSFSEELQNPFFEEFKTEIYNPANGATQGYPFYGVDLSLEKTPVVAPNYKVTKHNIKECVSHIRSVLTTHKVTYNKQQPKYNHDIPEDAKAKFALREKISEVTKDMKTNLTKYRLTEANKKGFAVEVTAGDLIVIINPAEQQTLYDTVPNIVAPTNFGFSPRTLGAGTIIESPHMKEGTALIIHKDALKFILIKNEVIEAFYPEHKKINRVHRLGWMMDAFELFPCAFIKPA